MIEDLGYDGKNLPEPTEDIRVEVEESLEKYPPEFFWNIIHQFDGSLATYQEICSCLPRKQLATFIFCLDDMAGFFIHPPFRPPAKMAHLDYNTHALEDLGIFVITKGKDYFYGYLGKP